MAIKNKTKTTEGGFHFAYIIAALIVLGIAIIFISTMLKSGNGDSQVSSMNERLDRIEVRLAGIEVINDRLSSLDRQITEFQIALTERINSLESYMSKKINSANTVPDNQHTEAIKADQKPSPPVQTPAEPKTEAMVKYHQVKAGETLYRISLLYNLTVDELKRLNNLESGSVIQVGQKLKISNK